MNESILKLLRERYFLPTENCWDDIAKRVSQIYPEIYEYIRDMYFIPSSPTLMNFCLNNERRGTLSSCFPMGLKDSIKGIYEALGECALVTQSAGGIGLDFSVLRGSNEIIKTLDANSSGAVSFISGFDKMLDSIRQGGKRRGAGMGLLSIYHPDIIQFINAKKNLDQLNRLNLSIKIPNSFYEALDKTPDAPHIVENIVDSTRHTLKDEEGNVITTKQIWDLIIENSWKQAEPGIYNMDIAYNRCTVTNLSDTVICNPCLRDSVKVLTPNGIRKLKEIDIGDTIWSSEGWTKVLKKWKTGTKEVFKYTTTHGVFESTEDHEVISNNKKIPVSSAKSIDILLGEYEPRKNTSPFLIMDGLVVGDGSVHKASDNLVYLLVGSKDKDYLDSEIKSLFIKERSKAFNYGWEIETSVEADELEKTYEREIPLRYLYLKRDGVYSFLKGLYSANGSICGNRITFKSTSFTMISQVQVLLSSVGISAYYTTNKAKKVKFKNGEYECKQSYDLNITKDIDKFYESIGFLQKYKMTKLKSIVEKEKKVKEEQLSYEITNKKSIGLYDVWDITVDNASHTFWCDGFNISNCSEFVNIPYSSCNLASINLSKLVEGKKFNWEKFEELIIKGTRFLNNTIDRNNFPLKKIEDVTLKIRPLGLGYMGLAHALYKKGIAYNSDKAIKFVEEMNRYLTLRSMKESVELAKEAEIIHKKQHPVYIPCLEGRSYEAFDYDLFIKANERFFKHKSCREIDTQKLKEDIKKYGVRNSCFTSIAPTGSIAYLAECSSGVEPVFALSYSRKIEKENKTYDTIYISDPIFGEYLQNNFDEETQKSILKYVAENKGSCQGCTLLSEEAKKIFVTAGDISPMEHLDILEVAANNTSLSISKTINLPADATKEQVSEVFLEAHKRGIIGVTVYRDGCREGILVHNFNSERKDIIKENHAPKRPKKLPCEIHKVMFQGKKWIVFVGLLEDKPYEIFAGAIEEVNIPKNIVDGSIIKQKSHHYSFEYEDEILVDNIGKSFANKEHDAFARSISMSLRHGAPLKYVISTLNKSEGDITHFSKVLARTLKKYVDSIETKELCPTCGSDLKYTDGCISCQNPECGWSRCG